MKTQTWPAITCTESVRFDLVGPTMRGTGPASASALGPGSDRVAGVLVDPSVLHDDDEVLVGRGQQLDVLQWVARDDEQVGIGARFDDAELSRVWVARP